MVNITSADYILVENDVSGFGDFYGVKLKTGKWKNVVVVYGKVTVKEDPENSTAKMSFNYAIQDPADYDIEELESNSDFNNHLGDLLNFIILDSLENKEAKIGNIEPTTDTHSESPTE